MNRYWKLYFFIIAGLSNLEKLGTFLSMVVLPNDVGQITSVIERDVIEVSQPTREWKDAEPVPSAS